MGQAPKRPSMRQIKNSQKRCRLLTYQVFGLYPLIGKGSAKFAKQTLNSHAVAVRYSVRRRCGSQRTILSFDSRCLFIFS